MLGLVELGGQPAQPGLAHPGGVAHQAHRRHRVAEGSLVHAQLVPQAPATPHSAAAMSGLLDPGPANDFPQELVLLSEGPGAGWKRLQLSFAFLVEP